jgi:predicted enzyme related to lactoylglutathione lyase
MNQPIHFEIHASEPEKLVKFYEQVFGWKLTNYMTGEYWLIDTNGGINGGLVKRRGPAPVDGAPVNAFVVSHDVADVDAMFQKALDHGATVAVPKMAIPHVGWQAYVKDPDGNILGLHHRDPNAK